jgi:DNA transformation protein
MLTHDFETMRNLGPVSAAWLRQAGVSTKSELKRLGPVVAYRMVKQRQPKASLNLLWALAAALADKDWLELTAVERLHLHDELRRL